MSIGWRSNVREHGTRTHATLDDRDSARARLNRRNGAVRLAVLSPECHLGTLLGSASTVTAAFALRAGEPASRWVLLLALATLVLQVLVVTSFWAPSFFYQG